MSHSISARIVVLLAGTLLMLMTAAVEGQTTWHVDDDAPDDPGPGDPTISDPDEDGSVAHPFDAIQEGIDAAVDGDTVLVLDGTYTGDGNRDLDFDGREITLRSKNGPANCIMDCGGSWIEPHRGLYFHSGETAGAVLYGLTILHGSGVGDPNTPYSQGGAIYCEESSPTIWNCALRECQALNGGGMANNRARPRVINCVFSGNEAQRMGGGIQNYLSTPRVINCTFTGNAAAWGGGGSISSGGTPRFTNCILWGNSPDELAGSSSASYSDIQGGHTGVGNINIDPLFVDPDNDDYRLARGSPCIDAGCNWALPPDAPDLDADGDLDEITPLDLDDDGRFFDNPDAPDTGCGNAPIVDMGAYEVGGSGKQPCFGDLDDDCDVGLTDLATLLTHYDETDTCDGDLNCDGKVDLADLSALLGVYGARCPFHTDVMTWQGATSGAISLTHDDNRSCHYDIAGPAFDERGLKGTFNVIPGSWPTRPWHADGYAQLGAAGHELASHTWDHRRCRIVPPNQDPNDEYFHSIQELRDDCLLMKATLDPMQPGRTTVSFTYPYGVHTAETRQELGTHFLSARLSLGGLHVNPPTPPDLMRLEPSYVGGGFSDDWYDYAYAYGRLSEYLFAARNTGGWVVEEYHSIEPPKYSALNLDAYYQHLDDLADAMATGSVWVAPQGDVSRYILSRDAAVVSEVHVAPGLVVLTVDDSLPDDIFSVPLTLRTRLPATTQWARLRVRHNGQAVPHLTECCGDFLCVQYNVIADGAPIEISWPARLEPIARDPM